MTFGTDSSLAPAAMNRRTFLKGITVDDITVQRTKIYSDFKGVESNEGSIYFADVMFLTWRKDKILQISTMEYDKCVKCIKGTFGMAWRYSDKQK